ncbi:hypothetical protein KKH05_02325 [Patescibacteria group bacterium]|nr:hypothetical protein [Patescibacteria group bacterium]
MARKKHEVPGQSDFFSDEVTPERKKWLVNIGEVDSDGNVAVYPVSQPDKWVKFGVFPGGEIKKIAGNIFLSPEEYRHAMERIGAVLKEGDEAGRFEDKPIPPVVEGQQEF